MVNHIRRLDCFIARVIFIFLYFFQIKLPEKNKKLKRIRKILCIKLWGLGNLVIIYPLLYKLKEKFPEAQLIFFTFNLNKGFLESNQAVDRIIYFEFSTNIFRILRQLINLIITFKKERVDLLLNFETFNNTSALFSYLIKPPIRIGVNNRYEKIFYTYSIYNKKTEHISQVFSNLLRPLDINFHYNYFGLKGSEKNRNRIKNILIHLGIDNFVCIHPGTSENFKGKRYREDYFSELSNLIIDKYNYSILFTGTKKEKDLIKDIMKRCFVKNKVFDLSGNLTIWEFTELLRKTFLFISNDSGPVHIAASLGVNTVVFYGPTAPSKYRPLNKNSIIFYKNMKCSPCVGVDYINRNCKNKYKCLDFLPHEVFSKISEKFFS
jgi:heptosyltransferase III